MKVSLVGVVEGTEENVIDWDRFHPLTLMEPDLCETLYPEILLVVYEYVPFGSENDIVIVVDEIWVYY